MKKEKLLRILGDNLTRIRKEKGLTQEELADKIGVAKQNISRIERYGAMPTAYTLHKISKALDVPVDEFFNTIVVEKVDV
jgi:putative transcriptional regulator